MVLFRWEANEFTGIAEFEPDDSGFAAFETLIQHEIKKPVRLLVDIIEEDFRIDSMPHLIGRDRQHMQKRTINKYFRQYDYTLLQQQGRSKEGRRDQQVLISALTNAKLFQPWLDVLQRQKIPLEGIYSLPLVGEGLLKPLGAEDRNALVITQQVPSSIRQSFYVKGKLKLSRLAPSDDNPAVHNQILVDETERTLRYLENQHYVDNTQQLHVYVVASSGEHAALSDVLVNDTRKQFHIIDKDTLAYEIGVKSAIPNRFSTWLYAQLLLNGKYKKHHYGTDKDKKYFYHYQAGRAMFGAAFVAGVVALFMSLNMLIDGIQYGASRDTLIGETQKYKRLYDETISDISSLNLDVKDVGSAITVVEKIEKNYSAMPDDFIKLLSQGLAKHEKIAIENIKWINTSDLGHSFGEEKRELGKKIMRLIQLGRKSIQAHKLLVEAVINDYEDNPRVAVEEAAGFVESLQSLDVTNKVDVIEMPFDVDPDSRMVGQGLRRESYANKGGAKFSFVIVKEVEL